MKLGVCYYPEQWPETHWDEDARRMAAMGISIVRIAEFAWSCIEPHEGFFQWAWLDRAVETLHRHGLQVVMCTPTATPPKWLIDAYPDVLAVEANGQPRGFGSRRHYCFSSQTYRALSARITEQMASRYGQHPAVIAWQTDNEYGCHDTVLSYSSAARLRFRDWLRTRYETVERLNASWGTVFWSQSYHDFAAIDSPVGTVTEAHPAHRLDYRRFASDEVVSYNRIQVDLLRKLSPGRAVIHNFMGFFTEFNHYDVARDLDIAGWDSYPLGFTQNFFLSQAEKIRWARVGHPDIAGFHHDLYRGMCAGNSGSGSKKGRWWVMEQQPGPVNWAQWNPAPAAGAVRLWTWQAFAHGAEVVSYFRWRQAPFAQEQMHAGLNRSDYSLDVGGEEAMQVAGELHRFQEFRLQKLSARELEQEALMPRASVALMFDYEAQWMTQIQPQGADYNYLEYTFRMYSALRQLGLDVDVVPPDALLDDYRLVVLPAQIQVNPALAQRLVDFAGILVIGARSGSKTESFCIEPTLPPGALAALCGVRVLQVESLPPGLSEVVSGFGKPITITRWREHVQLKGASTRASYNDGRPAVTRHNRCTYLTGWLDTEGLREIFLCAAQEAGITAVALADVSDGLRISRLGTYLFACNFTDTQVDWQPEGVMSCILGASPIAAYGVTIWQLGAAS